MRQKNVQEQLCELLLEVREYIRHRKEFAQLSLAEACTKLLGAIALTLLCATLGLFVLMFLGLALVHWMGALTGNLPLCYALFGGIMALILCIVFLERRKWIYLPIARLMTGIFLSDDNLDANLEDPDDETAE